MKKNLLLILLSCIAAAFVFLLAARVFFPKRGGEKTGSAPEKESAAFSASETRPDREEEQITILLKSGGGTEITAHDLPKESHGVEKKGDIITITQKGRYRIQGVLEEGQLRVDAGKQDQVVLILAGMEIANTKEAAIHVEQAESVLLFLEENTINQVQSGNKTLIQNLIQSEKAQSLSGKDNTEDAKGAAIYAKDDLALAGSGALKVVGGVNNGIHTKKRLAIEDGNLEVRALNHGIKGKDCVTIKGGSFLIFCGGSALRSDDDTGESYGEVEITGGSFSIRCGEKGVQALTALRFLGGNLEVCESYEGMEANQVLISGGRIDISARDDGINACGETPFPNLVISGGEIHINAQGDGLDSNGNLSIEGGTTLIDGPESDKDGPLDYGNENGGVCLISGGTVLAIGSAGMAQTFGAASSQPSFRAILDAPYQAGCALQISDSQGNLLIQHQTIKKGASVVFSSPDLEKGEDYLLEIGDERVWVTAR